MVLPKKHENYCAHVGCTVYVVTVTQGIYNVIIKYSVAIYGSIMIISNGYYFCVNKAVLGFEKVCLNFHIVYIHYLSIMICFYSRIIEKDTVFDLPL